MGIAAAIAGILGAVGIGLTAASMVKESQAAGAQIKESIADYEEAIAQTEAQLVEAVGPHVGRLTSPTGQLAPEPPLGGEAGRQIAKVKGEGVLSLQEQGAQTAYEARIAQTQAELTASAVENKLGASGVRQTGSPLLAAQQQVDLAYAQAERTTEAGAAALTLGGVRLAGSLSDISAMATLTTAEYNRRLASYRRKLGELQGVTGGSATGSAAGPSSPDTGLFAGGTRLSPR